jgi:predicted ATPase
MSARASSKRPPEPFLRAVRLREEPDPDDGFPWNTRAVAALHATPLELDPRCTFLVGANGSGKSTLLEGIAVAAGLGVQGGGRGGAAAGREDERSLGAELTLTRGGRRPRTDFFLRAESMLGFASLLDDMKRVAQEQDYDLGGDPLTPYGGVSLHEQSHGESFLAVVLNRFGPNGLYLLDEPESALSPQNILTLIARIHDLAADGSQFIIATHSPLLLALPGATIIEVSERGLERVEFDDVDAVRLTRTVLADPAGMMRRLLADD